MEVLSLARRYEIIRLLSSGGMAEVFLAKQTGIDGFEKLVVVKRIRPELSVDRRFVRMFLDEARTVADLRHPNIVSVFEVGRDSDNYFIVMEYLDGRSVHELQVELVKTGALMPEGLAIQTVIEAASALHYAHEKRDLYGRPRQIVHRDVSPHNILITFEGQAKLLDFGIAQATRGAEVDEAMSFGKISYMSPEQAAGQQVTPRTDQFSLAVILYELTTGVRMFAQADDAETLRAVRTANFTPPSSARLNYPPALERILRRALDRDPLERFQDCGAFAAALEEYLATTSAVYSPRRLSEYLRATFGASSETEPVELGEAELTVAGFGEPVTAAMQSRRDTNLVARPTSFIGRHRELQEIDQLFLRGKRLVTVLGPAGVGKTRLAGYYGLLHVEDYSGRGGVWSVDMTTAHNAAEVYAAIADPLGIPVSHGTEPVAELGQALADHGALLLILDNYEHLVGRAQETLAPLLHAAQQLRLLVTSRERLHLEGEVVYTLEPLDTQSNGPGLSDAVQVFVERARDVRTEFDPDEDQLEAIVQLGKRLDGLPLAIELAAARMAVFAPSQLLERVETALDLLGDKRGGRHSMLRAAVQWSWDLLDGHEKAALAQMSVFRGGFDFTAAEAVVSLPIGSPPIEEAVQALREKSLVHAWQPEGAGLRFRLLESIRVFAAEQIADASAVEIRHARYYLDSVDVESPALKVRRHVVTERDNLIAVHTRGLDGDNTPILAEQALRAVLCLELASLVVGPATYAQLLDSALERADAVEVDEALKGRVELIRGIAWRDRGRVAESEVIVCQVLEKARARKDGELEIRALGARATLEWATGRLSEALETAISQLALAKEIGNAVLQGDASALCGNIEMDGGNLEKARAHHEMALTLARETDDLNLQVILGLNRTNSVLSRGDYEEARRSLQEVFLLNKQLGSARLRAAALGNWALLQQEQGRLEVARRVYRECVDGFLRIGNRRFAGVFGLFHASASQEAGALDAARTRIDEVLTWLDAVGGDMRYEGAALVQRATLLATQGELAQARKEFARGHAKLSEVGDRHQLAAAAIHRAHIEVRAGGTPGLEDLEALLAESFEVRIAHRLYLAATSNLGDGPQRT